MGRRAFSDDQVLAMLDLRTRMPHRQIAKKFNTTPLTVRRILTGQTYRSLTHDSAPGKPCHCPACRVAQLSDENIAFVRALPVTLACLYCSLPAQTTVAAALAYHGLVACESCDRRKH